MLITKQQLCTSTEIQRKRKEKIIADTRVSYGKEKYISLLDREEKEYVRDFFGGLCADFFPCTAKCFEETVLVAQQDGLRMVTGDDRENGWVDGIFLKEIRKDGENYIVSAGATVIHPVWEMALEVDFYQIKDGKPILLKEGIPFFSYPYIQTMEAKLKVEEQLIREEAAGVFMTACMIGQDNVMRLKTKALEFSSFAENYNILSAVRVLDPLKKQQEDGGEEAVIVCYDRMPSYEEKYDYLLYFSEGGFYIPSKGEAVFADINQKFGGALSIGEQGSSSMLTLIRKNGGGIAYFENKPGKNFSQFFSFYVDSDTKLPGFQWDFKTVEWQAKNPLPVMEILEADYGLTVSYRVAGTDKIYHMMLYSGTCPIGSEENLPSIRLYWGCLCKDTRIQMFDFSEVMIQDVNPGDIVYSGEKPLRVRDVITGKEQKGIYKLTAGEEGKEPYVVYLTAEHPVITNQGMKVLLHIVPYINEQGEMAYREQVRTIKGDYVPIRSVELAMAGTHTVYNLVLESVEGNDIPADKAVFYANGLAVGDNQMQFYAAKLEEQRLRETRGLDRSWKTDMETAANYFQIYNQEGILWKN